MRSPRPELRTSWAWFGRGFHWYTSAEVAGTFLTHTTDGVVLKAQTRTHSTDVLLAAGDAATVVHATDVVILRVQSRSHTTDALLAADVVFHTTDAVITVGNIFVVVHTTDALVHVDQVHTHTTDALLSLNNFVSTTFALVLVVERSLVQRQPQLVNLGPPALSAQSNNSSGAGGNTAGQYQTKNYRKPIRIVKKK